MALPGSKFQTSNTEKAFFLPKYDTLVGKGISSEEFYRPKININKNEDVYSNLRHKWFPSLYLLK
jgi:hypothetical protein